jgi:hypothetical protein
MNFLLELAQQPLFKLLGAIIVLLLTDMNPLYGLGAGLLWLAWVVLGVHASKQGRRIY